MSVVGSPAIIQQPEAQRLRSLYQLLVTLSTAHSLADVYEAAISSLLESTGADRAAILIFDDDGAVRFRASRGLSREYQEAVAGHSPWSFGDSNAQPLVVEDVCGDGSPAVYREVFAREGIRALALIPLALDGEVFGKFMLCYREPHACASDEVEIAQAIATHVSIAAGRKRAELAHTRTAQRLQAILDHSPAVISVKDAAGRYLLVNRRHVELFGEERQFLNRSDFDIFPRDFAEAFRAHDLAVLEAHEPLVFEETVRQEDGIHTYISVKFPVEETGGRVTALCCIATDITERKRLEEQLLLLLEASGSLLATPYTEEVLSTIVKLAQRFISADGYAVWRERREEGLWTLSSSAGLSGEFIGRGSIDSEGPPVPTVPTVIPDVKRESLLENRQETLRREGIRSMFLVPLQVRGRVSGTIVFYWKTQRHFADWQVRLGTTVGNLASSALATAELYEEQLELRAQAEAAERRATFLAEAGMVLGSSLDYQETLAGVARLAVPTFADWAAVDILGDSGSIQRLAVTHSDPDKVRLAYEFNKRYPPREQDPVRLVLRTRKSMMVEISDERIDQVARDAGHAAALRELGIKSFIVAPMVYGGRSLGTITFATAESARLYSGADLQTAEDLAHRAAMAVEHARLHREALANEERLRAIVETTPECVKVVAADGTLLHMNSSGLEMIGAECEEGLIGTSVYDLIAPEFRDRYRSFNEAICRGERGSLEFDIVGLKGHIRHMESHSAPLRQADGTVHLAITRDITQRRERERAVLLLGAIVDSSDDAIISKDLNGTITSWNKGAERIFGYTAAEAVGRPVTLLIPLDRIEEEPNILARLKRGERVDHFETVRRRKDGTLLDISLTISPVKDPAGNVVGASKIARDITERKRAEAALRASEARFRQFADAMPHFVWTACPDGSVDYCNERWYEFIGLPHDASRDANWLAVLHPDDLQRCHEAWSESMRSGQPYQVECRAWDRKEKRWRWFMSRALPVRDGDGNIVKWFGSTVDIDDQKRVEDDLRRANQDLEQFAFTASHDLQEPLRSVSIYSELLATTYAAHLDGQGLQFLTYLHDGARRMQMLVRDLLAYTQVANIEPPEEPADAGEALAATLANMAGLIAETGARVTADPLPSLRVRNIHLQQLFQNLVGNAIKYRSPDRPPVVHVTAERRNGCWVFSVSDNGIGIDPAYSERIFGLFKRLHTNEEYSGTGIGLAICQRIVDRYHGRIRVESEPGRGSIFRFVLPL